MPDRLKGSVTNANDSDLSPSPLIPDPFNSYEWRKRLELQQDNAFSGRGKAADQDAEIRRLKKEPEALREEHEFFVKPGEDHSDPIYP